MKVIVSSLAYFLLLQLLLVLKGGGLGTQSQWSVVWERQKQQQQQETLACPMLAQAKLKLAAALSFLELLIVYHLAISLVLQRSLNNQNLIVQQILNGLKLLSTTYCSVNIGSILGLSALPFFANVLF